MSQAKLDQMNSSVKYLTSRANSATVPVVPVGGKADLKDWSRSQPKYVVRWLETNGFKGQEGRHCLVPAKDGSLRAVLLGVPKKPTPWDYCSLPARLPSGRYELSVSLPPAQASLAALSWLLGTYRFSRYRSMGASFSQFVWPKGADREWVNANYFAMAKGRDLITTPAEDMGPSDLAQEVKEVAEQFGASFKQVVGTALLKQNFPSIHAVGRAAADAPRLLDLQWGPKDGRKVTLVGKGVCFDSGGLDIKPAASMKLMKKDMGGAATVLAAAQILMALNANVRLRVLIPAVENAVGGNAFRPLDVLQTRKGLTVEVGHTDAEGRLILSDALALADEEEPDLIVCIATLTGAARVALGTELPALFCTEDSLAQDLLSAGLAHADPLWRMPLHKPYRPRLDSKVADINNVPNGSYGGAIAAALFLQEFVGPHTPWIHIDSMAYRLETRPGRPYGGEVFAARAVAEMILGRYGRA